MWIIKNWNYYLFIWIERGLVMNSSTVCSSVQWSTNQIWTMFLTVNYWKHNAQHNRTTCNACRMALTSLRGFSRVQHDRIYIFQVVKVTRSGKIAVYASRMRLTVQWAIPLGPMRRIHMKLLQQSAVSWTGLKVRNCRRTFNYWTAPDEKMSVYWGI